MEKLISSLFGKHYVSTNLPVIVPEVSEIQQAKKIEKVEDNKENSDSNNQLLKSLIHGDISSNQPN
jgi:hypothetical protein